MCRQPPVCDFTDLAQALRAQPGYVDRYVVAKGFEAKLESMKLEALAFEVERFTRQQGPHNLDCFSHTRERLAVSHAVEVFDDSRAARPETQSKTAAGDLIER